MEEHMKWLTFDRAEDEDGETVKYFTKKSNGQFKRYRGQTNEPLIIGLLILVIITMGVIYYLSSA